MVWIHGRQISTYTKMRGTIKQLLREVRIKDKQAKKLTAENHRLVDQQDGRVWEEKNWDSIEEGDLVCYQFGTINPKEIIIGIRGDRNVEDMVKVRREIIDAFKVVVAIKEDS